MEQEIRNGDSRTQLEHGSELELDNVYVRQRLYSSWEGHESQRDEVRDGDQGFYLKV
jgi:hypothetical protein